MGQIGLITYSSRSLGDNMRSLITTQFLSGIDHYIDRDRMDEFRPRVKTHVIVSGTFRKALFPTASLSKLNLLFVSFAIADEGRAVLAAPAMAEYYRRFEPIGCRDIVTMNLLKDIGVDAYFSGCMTLTLRNPFAERNNKVILVDPFYDLQGLPHLFAKNNILKEKIARDAKAEILERSFILKEHLSVEESFLRSQDLIKTCAQARMVITSQLPCALACVALETPVLFLCRDPKTPRFSGLIHLMHHCSYDDFVRDRYCVPWDEPAPRPEVIARLAADIGRRCNRMLRPLPWKQRRIASPGLFPAPSVHRPPTSSLKSAPDNTEPLQKQLEDIRRSSSTTRQELDRRLSAMDERLDWLFWRMDGYPLNADQDAADDVAVVMVVKPGTEKLVRATLRSLRGQTYSGRRISHIRVENMPEWNRAAWFNIGIRQARAKYTLLVDAGTVFSKDFLRSAVAILKKDRWQMVFYSASCFLGRTVLLRQMGGLDEGYTGDGYVDGGLVKRFRMMGLRIININAGQPYVPSVSDERDLETYLTQREKNFSYDGRHKPLVLNGGPWGPQERSL